MIGKIEHARPNRPRRLLGRLSGRARPMSLSELVARPRATGRRLIRAAATTDLDRPVDGYSAGPCHRRGRADRSWVECELPPGARASFPADTYTSPTTRSGCSPAGFGSTRRPGADTRYRRLPGPGTAAPARTHNPATGAAATSSPHPGGIPDTGDPDHHCSSWRCRTRRRTRSRSARRTPASLVLVVLPPGSSVLVEDDHGARPQPGLDVVQQVLVEEYSRSRRAPSRPAGMGVEERRQAVLEPAGMSSAPSTSASPVREGTGVDVRPPRSADPARNRSRRPLAALASAMTRSAFRCTRHTPAPCRPRGTQRQRVLSASGRVGNGGRDCWRSRCGRPRTGSHRSPAAFPAPDPDAEVRADAGPETHGAGVRVYSGKTLRVIAEARSGKRSTLLDSLLGLPEACPNIDAVPSRGRCPIEGADSSPAGSRTAAGRFSTPIPARSRWCTSTRLYSSTARPCWTVEPGVRRAPLSSSTSTWNYRAWQDHEHKACREFVQRTGSSSPTSPTPPTTEQGVPGSRYQGCPG